MRKPSYFYRNARAGEQLELFLVAAVVSLLGTRLYLSLLHYPSLGGGQLHFAHILPGGIMMVMALIISFAFLGTRVQRLAAILGGLGFGLFIDELGKFITRDNNYFFRPTVALIYVVFILLFILFRSLSQRQGLTQQEYLLNALIMTQEAVINDFDTSERAVVLTFLHHSDPKHPLVPPLRELIESLRPVRDEALSGWGRARRYSARLYRRTITSKFGILALETIFVGKAALFIVSFAIATTSELQHTFTDQHATLYWLQAGGGLISTVMIIIGVAVIRKSQADGYEWFRRSLLVDIFISQFLAFYRSEFGALPNFIINIMLYVGLRYIIIQEQRSKTHLPSA